MSDLHLLLTAILLPFAGAIAISFCGRWPNLREAITLITASVVCASVVTLFLHFRDGARLAFDIVEPIPGISISFELEALGMLFALIASILWLVTSIYAIGYMRGHHEKTRLGFMSSLLSQLAARLEPHSQATCLHCFSGTKF